MKAIIRLIVYSTFIILFSAGINYSQCIQTSGPEGGIIGCLASHDTTLFAGTYNGIYSSSDKAKSWKFSSSGFPVNAQVFSIVTSGNRNFKTPVLIKF